VCVRESFRVFQCAGVCVYMCVYVCLRVFEEDSLGVFRLGRVKSLETLGTMVVVIGLY